MRSRSVLFVLALACLLVPSWGAFGQDSAESDLLRLLRYVPDVPEVRETLVEYGDLAAWHTSWNVPRINTVQQLDIAFTQRDFQVFIHLLRVVQGKAQSHHRLYRLLGGSDHTNHVIRLSGQRRRRNQRYRRYPVDPVYAPHFAPPFVEGAP